MSHLQKNLDLLAKRQPELARMLTTVNDTGVEISASASGVPTARLLHDSASTALHSRYDPLKEARASVSKSNLDGADYFVLLGFGLGYVFDALIERHRHPGNRYFIVESSLGILKAAMQARDLAPLLSLEHVHFAWPTSGPELARQWKEFLDPVEAQKTAFVPHPPSLCIAPDLFKSAAEIIQSETLQIYTDINTLISRSQTFLQNFLKNVPRAIAAPGVSAFAGRFAGTPAILVSAGPSLDKNIHDLRGCDDSVLIVATDTALKPLLAAGVEPHFVMTGDPSYENYLHLKGALAPRALFVAEATAWPATFVEFSQFLVTCMYENSSLRSLAELMADKGSLRAWGSVATMAMDFALKLGCTPIIFIGQDLAHTDGRTYCSGLYLETEWFPPGTSPEECQKRWESLRRGKKLLFMEDIFGRPVETTDKLAAYWNWITKEISSHPGTRFINATEGGILNQGVEVMSLREALFRSGRTSRHLRARVADIYRSAAPGFAGSKREMLERLAGESKSLDHTLRQALAECSAVPDADPRQWMLRLEKHKQSIYALAPALASIVDCFNQMGNVAFLRSRAGLSRAAAEPSMITSVYHEYFASVRRALDEISPAFDNLKAIL